LFPLSAKQAPIAWETVSGDSPLGERLPIAWKAEMAMLIVAQRVSTIADADQILVLENGEIVGRGPHVELVTSCPTYAEIVEAQVGEGMLA
jgi:ABC-type protease/lipase transport system fused ATPase/permease subunit